MECLIEIVFQKIKLNWKNSSNNFTKFSVMCQTLKRTTGTQSQEFPRILVSCQNHKGGSDSFRKRCHRQGWCAWAFWSHKHCRLDPHLQNSQSIPGQRATTGHIHGTQRPVLHLMHCLWFPIFLNNYKNQLEQGIPGPLVYKALSTDSANKCLFSWLNYSVGISLRRYKVIHAYISHSLVRALSLNKKFNVENQHY